MRYSILGFNQEKVMQTNLDVTDLIILQYIQQACGSPKMKHIQTDDEQTLVWISHAKFHEDLPILDMSEGTFKNRLSTLKKEGFIVSVTKTNNNIKGSCSYYGITENTLNLLYSTEQTSLENDVIEQTTSRKNDAIDVPRHAEMTSYNILNSNSKLKEDISKDISTTETDTQVTDVTKTETQSQIKISKGLQYLFSYTDNEELIELLVKYYNARRIEPSTRISMSDYKYTVDDLFKMTDDTEHLKRIVNRTIQGNSHRVYRKWVDPDTEKTSYRKFTNNASRDMENLSENIIPTADNDYRKELLSGEAY